ncbi:MAG: hypothetical protein KGZ25_15365, partial [Planctomycetes bacterium]|nr:hypothetical protein [Planctomycetota bacterium]
LPWYDAGGNAQCHTLWNWNNDGEPGKKRMGLGLLYQKYISGSDNFYCPGRKQHGQNYGRDPWNVDYSVNWLPMYAGTDKVGFSPTLRQFQNQYSRVTWFDPDNRCIKYTGLRILAGDVRGRGYQRDPYDIPHDGTGNVLLIEGGVESLKNAFGSDIDLQIWSRQGPLRGDRNHAPYHPYGRDWFVWAAAQIRGDSIAP